MNNLRWLIVIVSSVFIVVNLNSMVWSGSVTKPAINQSDQKVHREIRESTKRLTTPVLKGLDLKIWMTPYLAFGPGGQTVHIKNIGTVGAGSQNFTAEFKARSETSNNCFERTIVKVVPGPNGELTIDIKGSDISNYLGSPAIGWLARITQSPPETNYNNNSHSINLTPGQCN